MAVIKAEHINPFLVASVRILEGVCDGKVRIGKLFQNMEYGPLYHCVSFGVTGQLNGNVVFVFDDQASFYYSNKELAVYNVAPDDLLIASTLCELCNIIIGNAAMSLEKYNVHIRISTPSFEEKKDMSESTTSIKVPLITDNAIIVLCFLLELKE